MERLPASVIHTGRSEVKSVCVTPDTRLVLTARDSSVKVFSLSSGECLQTLNGHTNDVNSISITPDGSKVVTGSDDKTVKVFNITTGACLQTITTGSGVWSVCITTDGLKIVAGLVNRTAHVIDFTSGTLLMTLTGHTDYVR